MNKKKTVRLSILRRKQVEARTGLSRSTIYGKLRRNPRRPAEFDPTFPRPIKVGLHAVGWVEAEIDAWLAIQIQNSRKSSEERREEQKRGAQK